MVDGARNSGGNGCLGYKCLENWIVLGGCQCGCAEGLDMEGDCRPDIGKRLLVSVALADDHATGKAKRISDVAIGVLFDDDFQLWCHVWKMPCELDLRKSAKSPNDPKLGDTRSGSLQRMVERSRFAGVTWERVKDGERMREVARSWESMTAIADHLSAFIHRIQLKSLGKRTEEEAVRWVRRGTRQSRSVRAGESRWCSGESSRAFRVD